MGRENREYAELVRSFHLMWDAFPGVARLIDRDGRVLAVNLSAAAAGHVPGEICAKIGPAEDHKGCRRTVALSTQTAQIDRPSPEKIRAWVPLKGHPDVAVHFSVMLPGADQEP